MSGEAHEGLNQNEGLSDDTVAETVTTVSSTTESPKPSGLLSFVQRLFPHKSSAKEMNNVLVNEPAAQPDIDPVLGSIKNARAAAVAVGTPDDPSSEQKVLESLDRSGNITPEQEDKLLRGRAYELAAQEIGVSHESGPAAERVDQIHKELIKERSQTGEKLAPTSDKIDKAA